MVIIRAAAGIQRAARYRRRFICAMISLCRRPISGRRYFTVIRKLLFASGERIRKIEFCNCRNAVADSPRTKKVRTNCPHGAISLTRNRIKRNALFFSPGLHSLHDRPASRADPNTRSETNCKEQCQAPGQQETLAHRPMAGLTLRVNGCIRGVQVLMAKSFGPPLVPGKAIPIPPGKLALENAEKLTPKPVPAAEPAKTEAEKRAETKRKNLEQGRRRKRSPFVTARKPSPLRYRCPEISAFVPLVLR